MKDVKDELKEVNGGDYGDKLVEDKVGFGLYCVGDVVEVYDSFMHMGTTKGTVIKKDNCIDDSLGVTVVNYYKYLIRFDNGKQDWYSADSIKTLSNVTGKTTLK